MLDFGIVVAFTAGVVSFLSPCVLPIIPGFLSYLAGTSVKDAKDNKLRVFINSVFFVLGFSVVFALLGVLLNTLLESVAYSVTQWLSRIGGAVIIFFGLYLIGLIRIKFLEQEHKFAVKKKFSSQYVTSFVFGSAFAAGWTPCVGAALGAILGLAASEPGSAFGLLMVYSLGLGLPFLIVALFVTKAGNFINKYAHIVKYVNIAFGIILIVLGILIFTGQLNRISASLDIFGSLGIE